MARSLSSGLKNWPWHVQIAEHGGGIGTPPCQWPNPETIFKLVALKAASLYIVVLLPTIFVFSCLVGFNFQFLL
nr:hypothetical protein Q903MT_gene990 [Picea sitchensis]